MHAAGGLLAPSVVVVLLQSCWNIFGRTTIIYIIINTGGKLARDRRRSASRARSFRRENHTHTHTRTLDAAHTIYIYIHMHIHNVFET